MALPCRSRPVQPALRIGGNHPRCPGDRCLVEMVNPANVPAGTTGPTNGGNHPWRPGDRCLVEMVNPATQLAVQPALRIGGNHHDAGGPLPGRNGQSSKRTAGTTGPTNRRQPPMRPGDRCLVEMVNPANVPAGTTGPRIRRQPPTAPGDLSCLVEMVNPANVPAGTTGPTNRRQPPMAPGDRCLVEMVNPANVPAGTTGPTNRRQPPMAPGGPLPGRNGQSSKRTGRYNRPYESAQGPPMAPGDRCLVEMVNPANVPAGTTGPTNRRQPPTGHRGTAAWSKWSIQQTYRPVQPASNRRQPPMAPGGPLPGRNGESSKRTGRYNRPYESAATTQARGTLPGRNGQSSKQRAGFTGRTGLSSTAAAGDGRSSAPGRYAPRRYFLSRMNS